VTHGRNFAQRVTVVEYRCALVVDDEEMIRRLIRATLTRHGITMDEASDGVQAMEILQSKQQYDVILLDLMMPRADGRTVLQFMKQNLIRIPVIIVTAAPPRDLPSFDPTQVKAVLTKPFDIETLFATVAPFCGQIRHEIAGR
jgi:CheY-like chemotaxis protein